MSGGGGARRRLVALFAAASQNELMIFREAGDRSSVERLGLFVQPMRGAAHRAIMIPWNQSTKRWECGRYVVACWARVASPSEAVAAYAEAGYRVV